MNKSTFRFLLGILLVFLSGLLAQDNKIYLATSIMLIAFSCLFVAYLAYLDLK